MKFTLRKDNEHTVIEEDGRLVYTIEQDQKDALISIALKNMYGDDVLHFYQIKKWYHLLKIKKINDFTIYEGDEKIGELHKHKDAYVMELHGVLYYVYGGLHAAKKTVIIFDREVQVAQFTLEEDETDVVFTNGIFGSFYALLTYLFKDIIKLDEFSEEAFTDHYKGMYLRGLDDIAQG